MLNIQEVYEQYFTVVYRYLLSLSHNTHIAEELTQETFFRAMKAIHKFKGECQLGTWLCQIAKHTYFSWKKKHRREVISDSPKVLEEDRLRSNQLERTLDEQVGRRQESMEIYRILHDLEEPYKEVFTLRVLGELSYSEIGEVFGRKEGWARVTFHRAKIKIQQLMQKGGR